MKKQLNMIPFIAVLFLPSLSLAADPGRPDLVIMDSVQAKAGEPVEMVVKFLSDDTTFYNNKTWIGIGSFCIPLKYDQLALTLDSIRFFSPVNEWDEKFTNPRIDTGFVSLAGIFNVGGAENPLILPSETPQKIARFYFHIKGDSKPGAYHFELTSDPIQKEAYFGSPDGYHSWKPEFVSGIILVKK